jgi:hypothetical protein
MRHVDKSDDLWRDRRVSEPDLPELRALGRLTWHAISLEDYARDIVRAVTGQPMKPETPTSHGIERAIRAAEKAVPQSRALEAAAAWLRNARLLLQDRNQHLHSVPLTLLVEGKDGKLYGAGSALGHFPKKGGAYVELPLRADRLNSLADSFRDACSLWRDVAVGLFTDRRDGDGEGIS